MLVIRGAYIRKEVIFGGAYIRDFTVYSYLKPMFSCTYMYTYRKGPSINYVLCEGGVRGDPKAHAKCTFVLFPKTSTFCVVFW